MRGGPSSCVVLTEPTWVNPAAVLRLHGESLIEFGGSPGIRDRGAIESALTRPFNLFAYGKPDLCALAAAYTAGLCQNPGFVDGNTRTAFLTGFTFLYENGYTLNGRASRSCRRQAVTGRSHPRRSRLRRLVAGADRS